MSYSLSRRLKNKKTQNKPTIKAVVIRYKAINCMINGLYNFNLPDCFSHASSSTKNWATKFSDWSQLAPLLKGHFVLRHQYLFYFCLSYVVNLHGIFKIPDLVIIAH